MEVNDKNAGEVMRGLEKYLREKFNIPNKANLRYDPANTAINYLHIEYYNTPVDGETDVYEVKDMYEKRLITKATKEQKQVVELIHLQLELLTAAALKS